jgi:type IV pilus assembly protein PilB
MKLGELLVKAGKVTKEQLHQALMEQRRTKEHLGQVLIRLGLISQEDIAYALAKQAGVRRVDLKTYPVDPAALQLIPLSFARKHKILPLSLHNDHIQIATANPFDVMVIDEVKVMTNRPVEVLVATEKEILKALDELYEQGSGKERRPTKQFEASLEEAVKKTEGINVSEDGERLADLGPVIELVNRIILQGVKAEATDIHIEPEENAIRVRYRIDGILHQFASLPRKIQSAVTTRIKIMSNLNISESRIPQDGRAEFPLEGRKIDLRISTFPGIFGENIVIRILDKERAIVGLEKLGFSPRILAKYKQAISKQNGIVLVTGPTGSGKTTTLYSTLSQLNSREKNIITLEDPVEYLLPMVRQSQINPRAGLTFASGLRAILRQDPDVILVGEIRDAETMEMAIRAALTGHLVFSTLHTNDAAGAVARLLDMGLEPFLLASSLIAVLSQRLVRVICSHCKEVDNPDEKLLLAVGWKDRNVTLYRGKGCDRCNHTGYRGRIGIFELLMVTPRIGKLVMERKESQAIKEAAKAEGMITMIQDGLEKVERGITTLEEVFRVAYI